MALFERLNPTLFDKLVADLDMSGLREDDISTDHSRETMRYYSVPKLERFNEQALRDTIRRELAWLLNTTNLATTVDLTPYPEVKKSVLNYGITDLTGQIQTSRAVVQRARDIRNAIRSFEPRISEKSLHVEPVSSTSRQNIVTYLINGDITSAVKALPVAFKTEVDSDTSFITVRE
jgi:type VI secretion system protein ImpF